MGRCVGRAEGEGVRVMRGTVGVPRTVTVEVAEEEGVREGKWGRVEVPDPVGVFEEEAEEETLLVVMEHLEGVEDIVEVLLQPFGWVPEGDPVEVFEEVVVAVEVGETEGEGEDREDLEKEEDPEGVLLGCMVLLPQGEAEEVLDKAAEREKVGVPVEVLEVDMVAVLVEVDLPFTPPDREGLGEEEEDFEARPDTDMWGEEEAVLDTVGVFVLVMVEVVVFVVVEEGEGRVVGFTVRDMVIVFVAVLLAVLVALLTTSPRGSDTFAAAPTVAPSTIN